MVKLLNSIRPSLGVCLQANGFASPEQRTGNFDNGNYFQVKCLLANCKPDKQTTVSGKDRGRLSMSVKNDLIMV